MTIGALWALGVVIEVVVFMVMHRLLTRFGARRVLLASLLLAALRWVLIGLFVELPPVQIFAQTLHAASFGSFHASAIHLTHHYFPGPTQGRGQALYNSVGFGLGGALGSLVSGLLWTQAGSTVTYLAAAGFAGVGLLLAWRHVDPGRRY
jgi:PPP family 3-phenylpropionic acid transporter